MKEKERDDCFNSEHSLSSSNRGESNQVPSRLSCLQQGPLSRTSREEALVWAVTRRLELTTD